MEAILEPLGYTFFVKGLFVAGLSGALLGFIGVYIVLRGMSYIGHGLSHSIFGVSPLCNSSPRSSTYSARGCGESHPR